MSRWRVGVDSGGTFTDICLFDEQEGRIETWKVPSTPDDPSRGIAQGVREEGMRRVAPEAGDKPAAPIVYFGHGTTVATNALIQHRGVKTGLVTTDGFRDLLEIGRQKRPDLYDIQADKPLTLVPRDLRLEVPERLRHTGEVDVPLDEDEDARRRLCLEGSGREGRRRVLPLRLHPSRSREARGRNPARGDARRLHLGRPRDRAGVPRVRAAVDGGAERLSRAGDGELHPPAEPAAAKRSA